MTLRVVPVALLAAALAVAACSGPGAAAKPTAQASAGAPAKAAAAPTAPGPYTANGEADGSSGKVSLQAMDSMKFSPNTITKVKPGQQVAVEVKNAGATVHDFYAPGLGVATALAVQPGQTGTATFTAPSTPGTYQFWCNQPGHAQAGMVGQVVVQS